ncbi:SDR family oxidoreductase [Sandaracinobacter sp. RS1-74]|uniref:SDR family NAD(P)-dependent oxidoreductase n=1 Tax=Sandaracinobacteroides sayramensis TaxID=2913411 RepID=UPI001EDA4AA4|nr:SDR family NAD(P)-dependent oxidoreductase [Sandaracinobacteroides sayramensis]MCG2839376.1 SDR family oxidoreductase [Sandaracinobacteroides sayramensis]
MKLKGKVALVTGAASGIGRQAALALAREGAAVLATDVDESGGAQTLDSIRKAGGEALFRPHDVKSEEQWADAVATALEAFGRLDILVNNAGIGSGQLVTEMSLDSWNNLVAVNLTGVFLGCKHAIPAMRAGRAGGSIVNISSVAGLEGAAGLAGYCATKGGVRLFTKAVAKEYAADGIRCNSVHPGIIDTPIWTRIDEGGLAGTREQLGTPAGANAIAVDAIAMLAPLQRPGLPEEIANGIVFLASDDSSYMTGSELVIDGGMSA